MAKINFSELRNALDFVSSAPKYQHKAYICIDSGIIYWVSETIELEEEVPDDLETSESYISVPHKNDLKLGQSLALSFISQEIPHDYNFVANLFRKRGAYRRFKELLQLEGLFNKWLTFEANASDAALKDWCREKNIEVI